MKYAFAAVALAALVTAQSLSDIPQCAVPCIDDARKSSTNCASDDYVCICKNKDALTAAATGCVISACGADVAATQVLPAVNAFCDAVGSGSGGSSASSSATVPVTSTVTSVGGSSTSSSVADSATGSSGQVSSTPAASASSVASGSGIASNGTASSTFGTGSPTNSYPTTIPTAGAASVAGSLAMLAFGFAAAL
ncbi:hypothetical protein F5Y05DRAFT_413041 [Hypoxylon sp. FL0543]|nr:hypothetical protein F5Y05DRAFT_413041 [Hypoxylon sp. FL0543]